MLHLSIDNDFCTRTNIILGGIKMIGSKALYAQVAAIVVFLPVAPSDVNAQIYEYRCTESLPNLYHCTDGEHASWDRYNPYSWTVDPIYVGRAYEIAGTPSSEVWCAPVRPGTNSRRVVRGRVLLRHPIGLPSNPATASHWANIECTSPPPPPPPPPPVVVFNETPSSNLDFTLCLMGVKQGAPHEIGMIQVGEPEDSCALYNPGDGVDEIESPPNNF